MKTHIQTGILLFFGIGCGGVLSSSTTPQSFGNDVCSSIFSCMTNDEIVENMSFENEAECRDALTGFIEKDRWDAYLSTLDSTEPEACSEALAEHVQTECVVSSMDTKSWIESIDISDCAVVYLYSVIGEWNGSCTNPATGEVREFILDIKEVSGTLKGDANMTIISPTEEESTISCTLEFEYSPSEIFTSQLLSSNNSFDGEGLLTMFSCEDGSQFTLPLSVDADGLLGYCDNANDIPIHFTLSP